MPQRPPNRVNTQSPNRPAIRPSLGKPAPQNEIANDLKNFSINQPASPSQQSQRTVVIGGSSGGSAPAPSSVTLAGDVTGPSSANTLSSIMSVPLVGNLLNGQAWYQSGGVLVPVTLTFGTVTNFTAGDLSPIFTTSVATSSTTPALTFTLSNAAANTALMGPTSGGAAAPTYRPLVAGDIPNLDAAIIATGTMATARLGSGTANNTTFLRGDQTWATPGGGSSPYTVPLLANFTIGNTPTGATFTDTSTGLRMICPTNSLDLQALVDNTAVGASCTITAGFNCTQAISTNTGVGVFIQDGSGKIVTWGVDNTGANGGNINYWNSFTSFNSNPLNVNRVVPYNFIKLVYDGTNFYFWGGTDLNGMILVDTISATAFIGTPVNCGLWQFGYDTLIVSVFFDYTHTA